MCTSHITDAETRLGVTFPTTVRALYEEADGTYNVAGQWWVVWPLERLVTDNERAWSEERLPRSLLAFGDDGTGDPFCVQLGSEDDVVLRWSWIDNDVQVAEGSMAKFAAEWIAE
jgi:SMI1 / KNR4 family (SUKH-1)